MILTRLLADTIVPVLCQYLGGEFLRHIHQGEFILDVDFPDGVTGDVGVEGDRADHIVGADTIGGGPGSD